MASLNHVSTVDIMNCPQDPHYEHVILWQADQYATAKERRDAFYDSTIIGPAGQKVKFSNVSYIRHNGGTIKLQAPMNLLKNRCLVMTEQEKQKKKKDVGKRIIKG